MKEILEQDKQQILTEKEPNLDTLLNTVNRGDILGFNTHVLRRKCIPNSFSVLNVDEKKWILWRDQLEQRFQWNPEDRIQWEGGVRYSEEESAYAIHFQNGITVFRFNYYKNAGICFDPQSDQKVVNQLKDELKALKQEDTNFEIGFIFNEMGTLRIIFKEFTPYKEDFSPFFGAVFNEMKEELIASINDEDSSGLYLLHGKPGTGKTSFIKSILSKTKKKAIYLTPGYTNDLTSPELIGVLMNHPGSILIIEDAETVLMKRQADNSNAVSNLLNLTDGFPADFLKLHIICTFNTGLDDIDPALLREGRLKVLHEFKKLSPEVTSQLALHLGKDIQTDQSMTLAEVCNSNQRKLKRASNGIGF